MERKSISISAPHVIAIDGPSASGKGTVAQEVARRIGFHYLDSGALYRALAFAAIRSGINLDHEEDLVRLAEGMNIRWDNNDIYLNRELVTDALREEQVSAGSSQIAALPGVRSALLARQRAARKVPGLVADGRDMGSTVFPDALVKIYLTADTEERARRRYKQLIGKGLSANMAALLQDILARDERDSARPVAPLQKGDDASVLDTTRLTIAAAVDEVLARYAAAIATNGRHELPGS